MAERYRRGARDSLRASQVERGRLSSALAMREHCFAIPLPPSQELTARGPVPNRDLIVGGPPMDLTTVVDRVVQISDFKKNPSRFLQEVAGGMPITITQGGKPTRSWFRGRRGHGL